MRYRELITEKEEPADWFKADLETVFAWMDTVDEDSPYTMPGRNDSIVGVGLVGDPNLKLKNKEWLIWAQEAFDELNKYEPGETVSVKTQTRLIKLAPMPFGVLGYFTPDDPVEADAWYVTVQKVIAKFDRELSDLADDRSQVTTLIHEAMHRGFAIWRLLVKDGQISPSPITDFVLNKSKDGKSQGQATGEHAAIYSIINLQKRVSVSHMKVFIQPWAEANQVVLKDKFGIGTPEFNDRYVDLEAGEPEYTSYYDQLHLWLKLAYEQAEREMSQAINRRRLVSPRPRLRGDTDSASSSKRSKRTSDKTDAPDNNKSPLKNKDEVEKFLQALLVKLQTVDGYATKKNKRDALAHIKKLAGVDPQPRHNEINRVMFGMIDEMFRTDSKGKATRARELTPEQITTAVKIIYTIPGNR